MEGTTKYDVAIIGGGLAGLALSIQLSKAGFNVVVLEKEKYPFHKVCGEYISLESWDFLNSIGVELHKLDLPKIDTLQLTSVNGKMFQTKLPLGGFGISRFTLDHTLFQIAKRHEVKVLEETVVEDVVYNNTKFTISYRNKNGVEDITAKVCCGSFGKRSNLDVKWKRSFLKQKDERIANYIGVKYHVRTNKPYNKIALHNFKNGYCGISKIEGDKYCLCYMTKASNLKSNNNNIHQLEQNVLSQNPYLKNLLSDIEVIDGFPVTISQISFSKKGLVENGIMMLGDAAGMITPLCGNGMSMALHSSKIAFGLVHQFLTGKINRAELEYLYVKEWNKAFAFRLKAGRKLQSFFGNDTLSNLFVATFKALPFLANPVIKLTHGKPF